MKLRIFAVVIVVLLLTACAPKYHYLNTQVTEPEFDTILVVFDYLHFVDDVGKLFDYPEDKNQLQIDILKDIIASALYENGFDGDVDFALISSGLGLNPEVGFEHYIDGKLSEELLYPPFFLQSPYDENFQNQLIQSFADAQQVAMVPVSKKNTDFYKDLRMNPVSFNLNDAINPHIDGNSRVGILHIRVVMPRVSFMKAMGVSLLTVGLTAGATGGAYIGIATPIGMPHSTGLLFNNQTGELIWKNQISGDLTRFGEQAKSRFFKEMPVLE